MSRKATQPRTQKYYLGTRYPGVYLTRREAHCMVCALDQLSLVKTAARLGLSPRTVEAYLLQIKTKLACTSKQQLLAKIIQTDFMAQVPTIRANLNL